MFKTSCEPDTAESRVELKSEERCGSLDAGEELLMMNDRLMRALNKEG